MSKKHFLSVGLALILLTVSTGVFAQSSDPINPSPVVVQEFAPDQILARFEPWVGSQRADQILAARGITRLRRIRAIEVDVLRLPPGLSVERAVEIFEKLPEIQFAEPNYILRIMSPPAEEITDQWGLTKIQAPEAWGEIADRPPVLLAIVDTGIDPAHTDLAPNIWSNPGETPGNGLDDDGNGYVDDTWGWDFINNDNDPFDDNMHGTAVSSTAAAVQDGSGVSGVCPWCQVAGVKVLGANGSGPLDTVASGIVYAADIGARSINLSLGGSIGTQTLAQAVDYAWNNGVLVVAAAGNGGGNTRSYPAAYANAMSIASTNEMDYRSCFSNYGNGYISVAAPGEAILVAVPGQDYGTYSGTSLSTPHVTGLGGLLFSQNPARTNTEVRALIQDTANDLGPTGTDAYFGSGRINAYRAVLGDTTPTDPPAGPFASDLTASGYAHARKLARTADGKLHLVWHNQDLGMYRVLYTTSGDNGNSWSDPQVVFESSAGTFHPALAVSGTYAFIAFPTRHESNFYRVFFTRKALSGNSWSIPSPLVGGTYDAVRPDLYYDPSNEKLHLVASSFDNAPYVYHMSSSNDGAQWGSINQIYVGSTSADRSRYATVHAYGPHIYIAGRTIDPVLFGLNPLFRAFSIRSDNNGNAWNDLTELARHQAFLATEAGVSMAGDGDRLYLAYEHVGNIYFRTSQGGGSWSDPENLGMGVWPSVTQAVGGEAWLMSESGGSISLRHYSGTQWDPAEIAGEANYPNLKLGISNNRVEWVATHCSGTPYRLAYGSQVSGGNNPPIANAGGPYSGTEDIAVLFDGSGSSDPDGDPITHTWDFGDNNTGTGVSPSHVYAFGGTFTVTLTVDDGKGGVDTDSTTVTVSEVNDLPVADANGPYSGSVGAPIIFDGSGSYDPDNQDGTAANDQSLTYTWDFGDGSSGSGVAPNHTYDQAGDYTVTLVVNDGVADSAPATAVATVAAVNAPPVANDVTVSGDEDTTILWTPSVSDPDGDPLTCSIVSQPSNGFASVDPDCVSGSYLPDANFNGSDAFSYRANDGSIDSNDATVSVGVNSINDPPVAAFGYVCTDLSCSFNASGSSDPDGIIVSYTWIFGDGNAGNGVTTNHTYAAPGTYAVTLTVTDDRGATDDVTQNVSVSGGIQYMHVGDLDGSSTNQGRTWTAQVTIHVHDGAHNPVAGATVWYRWNGRSVSTCVTSGAGACTVSSGNLKKNQRSVTLTVNSLTHTTLSYDPGANHDPDGDSDGTTITVAKP